MPPRENVRKPSAAVTQCRGHGVDGQLDAFPDPRVGFAGSVTLQQLNLQQIQWLDIGQAQPDGSIQRRMLRQQARLARDIEQVSCVVFHAVSMRPNSVSASVRSSTRVA